VPEKRFVVLLTDRDRIVTRITTERGAVEHYSLQYEGRLADTEDWKPIRRYDCSHDIVHRHVYSADGTDRRTQQDGLSFKEGLHLARAELYDDWERFRRTYEES